MGRLFLVVGSLGFAFEAGGVYKYSPSGADIKSDLRFTCSCLVSYSVIPVMIFVLE